MANAANFGVDGVPLVIEDTPARNMICKEYDPSKTYPTYSKYCIQDNKLYEFIGSTTTTGTWDNTQWQETSTIMEKYDELNASLVDSKTWQTHTVTGLNIWNVPASANEVLILANMGTSVGYTANLVPFHIPNPRTFPINMVLRLGYAQSNTNNLEVNVNANTNGDIQLTLYIQNGTNHYQAYSRLLVYYR